MGKLGFFFGIQEVDAMEFQHVFIVLLLEQQDVLFE
jgi:hypothetical protein